MQTSERQKEIIQAAFDLISEQGIQELTIKKIAQVVGVTEPAIYRHFTSKVDILSAVIDEMVAQRNAAFLRCGIGSGTARDMIRSFFAVQASFFESNPSLSIMLFPEDLFRNNADLLGRATSMMDETLARFRELLLAGIDEGSLKPGVDCEAGALMLVGGFRLLVASWRLDAGTGTGAGGLETDTARFMEGVLSLISR
ncbi:MAG TPA: TetR/AcrR family transcriptional regulator [Spirochaetales bacterium]|nr:TetR/AcrR family transcriptional regulator [Spirochaetales bacterium]HPM72560.1 TetR/AcrR family transcriptional regulator [Spirochaetales bacterium]